MSLRIRVGIAPKIMLPLVLFIAAVAAIGIRALVEVAFDVMETSAARHADVAARGLAFAAWAPLSLEDQRALDELVDAALQDPEVLYAGVEDPDGRRLAWATQDGRSQRADGVHEVRHLIETRELAHASPLLPGEAAPAHLGTVVIGLSREVIRAQHDRLETVAFTATVVVSLATGLVIRRVVMVRLHRLLDGTRAITRRDLAHRVAAGPDDELGELGRSFNDMAVALEAANHGLEAAVEARTAELRKALDELKTTQSHLVQAEKMASLGTLLAGVAHELNNPVNYLAGNVQLMAELFGRVEDYVSETRAYPPAARVAERLSLDRKLDGARTMLGDCADAAARVVRLLEGLQLFSSPPDAPACDADLHAGIEATLTILGHQLKRGVQIERDFGPLPPVPCRLGQLNQVFLNLLQNAAQALGGRGHVRISTAVEGPYAVIRVADDGPGISPAALPHIFDPFFTTKAPGTGTGLGLAISYRIVQAHGGLIEAANRPEGGAEFTVRLPLAGVAVRAATIDGRYPT